MGKKQSRCVDADTDLQIGGRVAVLIFCCCPVVACGVGWGGVGWGGVGWGGEGEGGGTYVWVACSNPMLAIPQVICNQSSTIYYTM